MQKIIVNAKYDGKDLNNFILDSFPKLNKNNLFRALRQKDIKINGKRVKENTKIFNNDVIEIYISDELLIGKTEIKVIYEDENILAVFKDQDISVTDEKNENTVTLEKLVKKQFGNNLNPCHRLDRNTKGIVLFAKNEEALNILFEKFKNHEIEKHYLARIYGIPKENSKILKDYLFKDSKQKQVYISSEKKKGYQEIITQYTVLERDLKENTSILDINLHTGRTHQIRAHLAFYGFPIIGDRKIWKKWNK